MIQKLNANIEQLLRLIAKTPILKVFCTGRCGLCGCAHSRWANKDDHKVFADAGYIIEMALFEMFKVCPNGHIASLIPLPGIHS